MFGKTGFLSKTRGKNRHFTQKRSGKKKTTQGMSRKAKVLNKKMVIESKTSIVRVIRGQIQNTANKWH